MAKSKKEQVIEQELPKVEETIAVEQVKDEPKPEPKVEPVKEAELEVGEKTWEQRIVEYVSNHSIDVKLNMFLKSLYPLPTFSQPAKWLDKGECKALGALLDKMQSDGLITVINNTHKLLGKHYYKGDNPVTQYHNLDTVQITVKK